MPGDLDSFAPSYAQARATFLAAAAARGLAVQHHLSPGRGIEGEPLALDVALQGARDAGHLLIVSSACHGIEGYAGSAVQLALLRDDAIAQALASGRVALLHLHALNPHGFSWARRVTAENVDLNRNFVDFTRPLPSNRAYEQLAPLLIPERWPPGALDVLRVGGFILRHGLRAAQAALSSGQYTDPRGLFFGGHEPTWSQRTLRTVLREFASPRARIGWIDIHTGLGERGAAERILAAPHDSATLARARAWWGDGITSTEDESSSSVALHGQMWTVMGEECPRSEYTGIALELGTASRFEVLQALRGDHWLALHPEAPAGLQQAIRERMRAAFFVETADWKRGVLREGRAVVAGALRALA